MRLLKIAKILLAIILFAGCTIKEDLSDCPPSYNTTLRLHYAGDPETPVSFRDAISCITLFVFDGDGQFVKKEKISVDGIATDDSYKLFLQSGNYTVVCWANVTDTNTQFIGYNISDYRLKNPRREMNADNSLDTDDPLYFGTTAIVVEDNRNVSGDIYFEGAHIDIEIYLKGFESVDNPSYYPVIEIEGNIHDYGIMNDKLGEVYELYRPQVAENTSREFLYSRLNMMPFEDQNDLILTIRNPTASRSGSDVLCSVDINQYMSDNNISVEGRNEAKVSIMLEFTDLGITVGLPEWESETVDPSANR